MARSGLMASTANSFAHLLGISAAKGGKSKAEGDKPDEDDDAQGKGKTKADKPDDQGEDESDEDYKERKKREEEEARAEDDDDEMDKDDKSKAIRARENARCAAIFASPAAGARPDLAAHFAFNTRLSRKDAVATLEVAARGQAAPSKHQGLSDRMATQPNPDIRPEGEQQAMKPHQRLAAAHAKATGKKA